MPFTESLTEVALGSSDRTKASSLRYGGEVWARILGAADRVVVARLLGLMAIVCLGWGAKEVVGAID